VEESNPKNSNKGILTNSVELPVMANMKKINQNWKLLLTAHLLFNLLNIGNNKFKKEQK
jgi:hypothetical protein